MFIKKYKSIILKIAFIIFTVGIVIWTVYDENYEKAKPKETIIKKEEKTNEKKEKVETENKVIIDIKGEIVNPGVYELNDKNNVNDAINMAGGLTKNSDTSNINLSKKLSDEMVIIVYSKKEIENFKKEKEITCPPCNNACINKSDEKAKIAEEAKNQNEKININSATIEELLQLNGIGESKANAIIEYRTKNGDFKTIEDIKNVSGIGEAAFEKIKDQITT